MTPLDLTPLGTAARRLRDELNTLAPLPADRPLKNLPGPFQWATLKVQVRALLADWAAWHKDHRPSDVQRIVYNVTAQDIDFVVIAMERVQAEVDKKGPRTIEFERRASALTVEITTVEHDAEVALRAKVRGPADMFTRRVEDLEARSRAAEVAAELLRPSPRLQTNLDLAWKKAREYQSWARGDAAAPATQAPLPPPPMAQAPAPADQPKPEPPPAGPATTATPPEPVWRRALPAAVVAAGAAVGAFLLR